MSVYAPFDYILPNKLFEYEDKYDISVKGGQSSFRQSRFGTNEKSHK